MSDPPPALPPSPEGMEHTESESRRALRALCIEAFEHAGWSVTISAGSMMLGALPVFCDVLDGERVQLYAHIETAMDLDDVMEINEEAPFACTIRPYHVHGEIGEDGIPETETAMGAFSELRVPATARDVEMLAAWLDAQASEVAAMASVLSELARDTDDDA